MKKRILAILLATLLLVSLLPVTAAAAETIDEHGIITKPADGEYVVYNRLTTNTTLYPSGTLLNLAYQRGTATMVECTDGTVYWKNPISRFTTGAWIKGTKVGDIITFPAGQPVFYSSDYNTTLSVCWGYFNPDAENPEEVWTRADTENFVFEIKDGNILEMQDTQAVMGFDEPFYFPGIFWDDDNSFNGYGDCGVNLTKVPSYTVTNAAPEADANENHGYITINTEAACEGDFVTVQVWPARNYLLKSLTYKGEGDTEPTTINRSVLGSYQFQMPDKDITVTAEFEAGPAEFVTADKEHPVYEAEDFNYYVKDTTTWKGYSFAGWFYDDGGTEKEFTGSYDEAANGTIYTARWKNAADNYVLTDGITVGANGVYIGEYGIYAAVDRITDKTTLTDCVNGLTAPGGNDKLGAQSPIDNSILSYDASIAGSSGINGAAGKSELAKYGISFTPAQNGEPAALTLNDASIEAGNGTDTYYAYSGGQEIYAGIFSNIPLHLALTGDNTVCITRSDAYSCACGIFGGDNVSLTVTGDRLKVDASSATGYQTGGIVLNGGALTNSATLEAVGGSGYNSSYGISCGNLMNTAGKLTGRAGSGTYCNGLNLNVPGVISGGTVIGYGGSGSNEYYGLWTCESLTVSENGTLKVYGGIQTGTNIKEAFYLENDLATITLEGKGTLVADSTVKNLGSYEDAYAVSGADTNVTSTNANLTLTKSGTAPIVITVSEHKHDNITFAPWTDESSLPDTAGSYYLTDDVTLEATWNVPEGTTNLDLNGHVIKMTGSENAIYVPTGATLNLYDCDTTTQHKFVVDGSTGLWTLDETNGTKTVTGGVITGGNASGDDGKGGGVYNGGTFTMNGGTIAGCTAAGNDSACGGGGVYNDGGTFTMNGGAIVGCVATSNGGGVFNNKNAEFTMNAGSIQECKTFSTEGGEGLGGGVYNNNNATFTLSGGTIQSNTASRHGGGIQNAGSGTVTITSGSIINNTATLGGGGINSDGTVTMSGGTVADNVASAADKGGGGVRFNGGNGKALTLGGTAQITDNTAGAEGNKTTNNLYIPNGKTVTLGTGDNKPLTMSVGVTLANGTGAFTTNGGVGDIRHFIPDSDAHYVTYDGGVLKLAAVGSNVAQNMDTGIVYTSVATALNDAKSRESVKLLKDVSESEESITVPELVFLDLNHHAFTQKDPATITNNGVITLYQENENIIDGLLFAVSGAYGAGEELKLYENNITIPDGTFFTNDIEGEGFGNSRNQKLGFTIFDDAHPLVWNLRVPAGVQLDATYAMTLGGDIESAPIQSAKLTAVTANFFTLSKDIAIGDNDAGYCEATLFVESIDNGVTEPTIGTFNANGHKITINKTGKLILSSNVTFDDSVLVSGASGLSVLKKTDASKKTVTYYLGTHSTGGGSGTPTITVPVTGNENSVKVQATVSGSTATVKEIKDADFAKVADSKTIEIDLSGLNKSIDTVKIPTTTVEKIGEQAGMSVKLSTATVTFDAAAVKAISKAAIGADIALNVETIDKNNLSAAQKNSMEGLGSAVIVKATLISGGKTISDFGGGSAAVTVPYEPKNADKVVVVYYLDEAGKLTKVNSSYDAKTKTITFVAPHFSEYVISEVENSYASCQQDATCVYAKFTDADTKAWYHDGVHFCVANGIMSGVSDTQFAPSGKITRGMIVTMLWRLEGEPYLNYAMSFKDVASGQWYTEAIRWAAAEKIVSGYDAEHFGPNDPITREQLATILYNYAKHEGQGFTGSWMFLLDFVDRGLISSWADEAVHWCSMKGIVNGKDSKDGKVFDPQGKATRAEAATMVQRFCEALEK